VTANVHRSRDWGFMVELRELDSTRSTPPAPAAFKASYV